MDPVFAKQDGVAQLAIARVHFLNTVINVLSHATVKIMLSAFPRMELASVLSDTLEKNVSLNAQKEPLAKAVPKDANAKTEPNAKRKQARYKLIDVLCSS